MPTDQDAEQATPATQTLLAIALTRVDRMDEAKGVAQKSELSEESGPGVLYSAARMYAATGSPERAMQTLRRCFERVSPSQLGAFKDHARNCSDFAPNCDNSGRFEGSLPRGGIDPSKVTQSGLQRIGKASADENSIQTGGCLCEVVQP